MIDYIVNDGDRLDFEIALEEQFRDLYNPLDIKLAGQLLCIEYGISNNELEINEKMYRNSLVMH